jgi:hypothetical protein
MIGERRVCTSVRGAGESLAADDVANAGVKAHVVEGNRARSGERFEVRARDQKLQNVAILR